MVSESARYRPPAALRPLVAWYSGYREAGVPPARHRGLPSPYLTLIITLDDPLVVAAHPDPSQPASRHGVLVGGLHTVPALVTHEGRQSGIQLQVTPLGARALLGLPAGEMAGLDLEADDVLGSFAAELREAPRIGRRADIDQRLDASRFQEIDEALDRMVGMADCLDRFHAASLRTSSMKSSVAAELSACRCTRLSGTFRAGRSLSLR